MNISYSILGYAEITAEGDNILSLVNLCMRNNLPYKHVTRVKGGACFLFRLATVSKVCELCRREGIEVCVRHKGGLPIWFYKRRNRYGLIAGVIAAVLMVVFARNFLWRIDVVGNRNMTTSEILDFLEGYGLCTGSYIPSLNTDRIQNKMLMDTDKISWISVNINGNTASVEIREAELAEKHDPTDRPANLVASKSGKIVQVQLLDGNAVIKSGDIVSEGQLLVSGIFDSKIDGYRVTRADGKIYAETSEEFYIKIPYEYEKKTYTGREYYDEYLNFFDFSVKISKNSRNQDVLCDKISIVNSCNFLDGGILPISKTTEKYLEYEMESATRTQQSAEELAYFELSQRLRMISSDATLIRKVIMPEIHEDFFALRCVIVCIEDIAKTVEFEVDNTEYKSEDFK